MSPEWQGIRQRMQWLALGVGLALAGVLYHLRRIEAKSVE
jgi:hypothetical protein